MSFSIENSGSNIRSITISLIYIDVWFKDCIIFKYFFICSIFSSLTIFSTFSIFSFLAIYKRKYLDNCDYGKGFQMNGDEKIEFCEHVDFNQCVIIF
mgnify:CR=1 FL=1